jgi:hypothetical protein
MIPTFQIVTISDLALAINSGHMPDFLVARKVLNKMNGFDRGLKVIQNCIGKRGKNTDNIRD